LQQIWNVFELPRLMHEVEAGAHGVAVQWKQYDEPVGVQGLPQAPLSHVHVEYPPLHPSGIFATLFCMRDLPRAADVLAFAKGATMSSPIPIVAIPSAPVLRKNAPRLTLSSTPSLLGNRSLIASPLVCLLNDITTNGVSDTLLHI
jgi:hypothetical protein